MRVSRANFADVALVRASCEAYLLQRAVIADCQTDPATCSEFIGRSLALTVPESSHAPLA